MNRRFIADLPSALLLFILAGTALSQNLHIIPGAGISKNLKTLTADRWSMGYNIGIDVFRQLDRSISVGGRVGYHGWPINAKGWASDLLPSNYSVRSASGSQSVFELAPAVRLETSTGTELVKFSLHLGLVLLVVARSDVDIRTTFGSSASIAYGELRVGGTTSAGFGGQVGVPIIVGGVIALFPLYSVYVLEGDPHHHFAVNIGFVIHG